MKPIQKMEFVAWMLLMLCVAEFLVILTPTPARTVPCQYKKVSSFSTAIYAAECRIPSIS